MPREASLARPSLFGVLALAACTAPLDLDPPGTCGGVPCDAGLDVLADAPPPACPCSDGSCGTECGGLCLPRRYETRTMRVGREPRWTFLEDLDDDGFDDLVVPIQLDSRLDIAWGAADGVPSLATSLPVGRLGPGTTFLDYDGDGLRDLLSVVQPSIPGSSFFLRIVRRREGRIFDPLAWIEQPGQPMWVGALDADRDGRDDVAVRLVADDCVAIRLSTDTGLGPQRCITPYAQPDERERIAGGDVDGDGIDELFETRASVGGLELYRHTLAPDGSVLRSDLVPPPEGLELRVFDLRDLNHDGRAEVIFFSGPGPSTEAHILTPSGELCTMPGGFAIKDELSPEEIDGIGDFDGDGILDLAGLTTCSFCSGLTHLHLGRGE